MKTTIKAKKDLFHGDGSKSFTKGQTYIVNRDISNPAALMECQTRNDQDEPHIIGSFWRDFTIVK